VRRFSRGGKRCISRPGPSPALEQTGRAHARRQRRVNSSGEPGAYRKAHAGFGEGRSETPGRQPRSALNAYSTCAVRCREDRRASNSSGSESSQITKGATNSAQDWNGGLQQPSGVKCLRSRMANLSVAGYRRCHGEARVLIGTHAEVSVGSLCMEN